MNELVITISTDNSKGNTVCTVLADGEPITEDQVPYALTRIAHILPEYLPLMVATIEDCTNGQRAYMLHPTAPSSLHPLAPGGFDGMNAPRHLVIGHTIDEVSKLPR